MVRAGPLRDRIKIQNFTETFDETGGIIRDFTTVETRWGSIEPLQGDEKEFGDVMESRATHQIRMRHVADLDTKQRLVHGTRNFNIVKILNKNNRNRLNLILVREDI